MRNIHRTSLGRPCAIWVEKPTDHWYRSYWAMMFTTLMVAFLPTIISFSLTYMQETQFKAIIFKIINLMSDGFNATEVISTIISMFSTLIAFQNLEIDIPDPTDVYRHCFLQEGNLANLERIKRLNFLQGLISLKIFVTLPSRFYDRKMSYEVFLLKKVDEESKFGRKLCNLTK